MSGLALPRTLIAKLTALLILGLLLPGCTTTTIEPELVQKPAQAYDTIVIGEIGAEQEMWAARLPYFREA